VLADARGVTLERIAVAAATRGGAREHVALLDRDVGEHGAEEALVVAAGGEPDAVRQRGQSALDAPRDRACSVAGVGHDGALGGGQRGALLDAAAAAEPPGPTGVGADRVLRRDDWAQSLLALERLHREAHAEDRRRAVGAVAAVA